MNRCEVTINGNDGSPILYCAINKDGNLETSFEYYGRSSGEPDLEVINTIWPTQYELIKSMFSIPFETEILDCMQIISQNRHGEDFKQAIREKVIKAEHFSWMSDND
jgi:hypothetical protein